jgi:hypothetical protein
MKKRNNVSHIPFKEYVKDKVSRWKLEGKKINPSQVKFLKYPYITSVNNAYFRGESVPRKRRIEAFELKYQYNIHIN